MRRSQELLGLSLISRSNGQQLGVICDLLFDSEQKVCGLLVENGGWWRKKFFVPREEVLSYSKDAVVIEDPSVIQPYDQTISCLTGIHTGPSPLKGRTIYFTNGTIIGNIANVYFSEELGRLIGYEISDGWLNDLRYGRRLLRPKEPLSWQQESIYTNGDEVQIQEVRM